MLSDRILKWLYAEREKFCGAKLRRVEIGYLESRPGFLIILNSVGLCERLDLETL